MWVRLGSYIITPRFDLRLLNREDGAYTGVEFQNSFLFTSEFKPNNKLCSRMFVFYKEQQSLCIFCKNSFRCMFDKKIKEYNFNLDYTAFNDIQEHLIKSPPQIITKTKELPIFALLPAEKLYKIFNPLDVAADITDSDILSLLLQNTKNGLMYMDTVIFDKTIVNKIYAARKLFYKGRENETATLIIRTPTLLKYIADNRVIPEQQTRESIYEKFMNKLIELQTYFDSINDISNFENKVYQLEL